MSITNTRDVPSVIRCEVADVRRCDGIGPAFAPHIALAPEHLELAPGEEARVMSLLLLEETVYGAGAQYVARCTSPAVASRMSRFPLRITATNGTDFASSSVQLSDGER